jgi:hypothetical protein
MAIQSNFTTYHQEEELQQFPNEEFSQVYPFAPPQDPSGDIFALDTRCAKVAA